MVKIFRLLCSAILAPLLIGCHATTPSAVSTSGPPSLPALPPASELTEYQSSFLQQTAARPPVEESFSIECVYVGFGGLKGVTEVTVRAGVAELKYYEGANDRIHPRRFFRRPMNATELAELRQLIESRKIDQLPDLDQGAFDGVEYHFLHVRGADLHRIRINNPREEPNVYSDLVSAMDRLLSAKPMECAYTRPLPNGTRILFAGPRRSVTEVWAVGDDIRAHINDRFVTEDSWQALQGGQWTNCEPPPPKVLSVRLPEKAAFGVDLKFPVSIPNSNLMLGTINEHLYCYDRDKLQEVQLPDSATVQHFQPFEYFPELDRILLVHRKTEPYNRGFQPYPEWRLWNPHTLKSEPAQFDIWAERAYAFPQQLQPTRYPDWYWVALTHPDLKNTNICRFSRKTLRLSGLNDFILPDMTIKNSEIWANEKAGVLYAIDGGVLLRIPIPPEVLGVPGKQ